MVRQETGVDFDLCWAFHRADPWGHEYELNCYDYDRIRTELVESDGIDPVRYWPRPDRFPS